MHRTQICLPVALRDSLKTRVRNIGIKEGDRLEAHLGADGGLNLKPPEKWSRQAFAEEMLRDNNTLPAGTSVMEQLGSEARY